jgi:hypothetical protein
VIPGVPAIMRDVTARFEEMHTQEKPQSCEPVIMQVNRGGGLCTYGETILHDRTFDTANGRVR